MTASEGAFFSVSEMTFVSRKIKDRSLRDGCVRYE
jgi:hypothetical protein